MSTVYNETNTRVISGVDDSDLPDRIMKIMESTWPVFVLNDPVGAQYWIELYLRFPEFQLALLDNATNEILAIGNSIPAHLTDVPNELDERGWEWCIEKGIDDSDAKRSPNAQIPLAVTVPKQYQQSHVGGRMIQAMKAVGLKRKYEYFLCALRPSQKATYPLIPFGDYIEWKTDEGLPFDPWMRAHMRLGAKAIRPCYRSLVVTASVADWESWTGMRFPQTGSYVVPGALTPVEINFDNDEGVYVEPNLWTRHPMD